MQPFRHAFTLIELALVLVIVSLMTGFGLQAFDGTAGVNCIEATQQQLQVIDQALQTYAAKNQRLPKPSLMNLGTTDSKFGREALGTMTGASDPTTAAFATYVPPGLNQSNNTLIGALPHATLGLPAQYSADCWGDKFTYAVTNSQTSSDSSVGYTSGTAGDIRLKSGAGNTLSSTITYAVVSHGQDKYGAYALQAGNSAAGPMASCGAASKLDQRNCAFTDQFNTAIYNTGNTGNYFDDLMVYSSKIQSTEDCPGQSYGWTVGAYTCSYSTSSMQHGDVAHLSSSTTTNSGDIDVRCQDGTLVNTTAGTCYPTHPCPATPENWGGGCTGTTNAILHNQDTAGMVNTTAGRWGVATYHCNNGALTVNGGSTCGVTSACTAGGATHQWGGGNCSIHLTNQPLNGSGSGSNENSNWYQGSSTYTCTQNSYSSDSSGYTYSDGACTYVPPLDCTAQTLPYGSGCSINAPPTSHNANTAVLSNSASNHTGSAQAHCWNGTYDSVSNLGCHLDCAGGTQTWNSHCSGGYPALHTGDGYSIGNGVGGYSGNYSLTCNEGTVSGSGSCCVTDGNSTSGGTCCSADTDGNGLCGFQCQGDGVTYSNAAYCCSADTDGNGQCGFQCRADGVTSSGNPALCCSGDSDGNGTCGTQVIPGCSAGWSAVYHMSDEASYDCRNYDSTVGVCTSGTGGNSASSTGRTDKCIDPGSCVDARQCGCVADGTGVPDKGFGPQPQLCCNGDPDGNGTCGNQTPVVNGSCGGTNGSCVTGSLASDFCNNACPNHCTWNCVGSGGGTTANCSADTACTGNPQCGGAHYSCTVGTPDVCQYYDCSTYGAVGQNTWTWTCTDGGVTTNCSQYGSNSCFVPETLITLENGSSKPVSELKIGDRVKGQSRTNTVIKLPELTVNQSIYGFNGGKAFVTGGHPFFTADGWKAIDPSLTPGELHKIRVTKLQVGDVLLKDDGSTFAIRSIDPQPAAQRQVFNPAMDGDHTYYANGLLVHNKTVDPCVLNDESCGAPTTCAAGWSATFTETSEAVLPDCQQTRDNDGHGDCTSGTGGTSPSTTGNVMECHAGIVGGGPCSLKARICGCLADGDNPMGYGTGAGTSLCCNGDPDGNGQCGNQGGAATWVYTGTYGSTNALIAYTIDDNCGPTEYTGCLGCTSYPTVTCIPGSACGSETKPCYINGRNCTMDGGQAAYVWDTYSCQ